MIPLILALVDRIRMDQGTEWAPMDHQPGDEGTKLCRSEQINFEHGDGVRADGTVEEGVDSEFGDLCWFSRTPE